MGTTPTLALPYPEASDPADVPTDIHELATALDGLVHKVTYGTTPPASPTGGDEWILPADAANGVMWRFRYNAGSASPYKWEFVGGAPFTAEVLTFENLTSTSYVDLPTAGPSLTVPRAGDYFYILGVQAMNNTTGQTSIAALKVGAAACSDDDSVNVFGVSGGVNYLNASKPRRINGVAASTLLLMQYRVTGGQATYGRREFALTPVRVS
jgi:hypothetical protein